MVEDAALLIGRQCRSQQGLDPLARPGAAPGIPQPGGDAPAASFRLAAWLEQPVLIVPEPRTMIRTAVRACRLRRTAPLPLSDDELSTIRTPLYGVLGKRSPLVQPQRQTERVPHLIPGARPGRLRPVQHQTRRRPTASATTESAGVTDTDLAQDPRPPLGTGDQRHAPRTQSDATRIPPSMALSR